MKGEIYYMSLDDDVELTDVQDFNCVLFDTDLSRLKEDNENAGATGTKIYKIQIIEEMN